MWRRKDGKDRREGAVGKKSRKGNGKLLRDGKV